MTTTALAKVDEWDEQAQEQLALTAQAELITITDQETFAAAGVFLRTIKDYLRRVDEVTEPVVKAALAAHRAAVAQRDGLKAPALEAEAAVKRKMAAFEQEARRQRALAEARAAEEARVAAEIARRDGVPMTAPTVTPAKAVEIPKAAGVSFASRWVASVVDMKALVKAVADGKVMMDALQPNLAFLNDLARTQKDKLAIPGVTVTEERGARASSR